MRSYKALVGRDLGYEPDGVVTVEALLNGPRYEGLSRNEVRRGYWEDLMEGLRVVPGVTAVGVGNWIPTGGGGRGFIEVPGSDDADAGADYRVVSDDYFRALGVPLLAGRVFGPADDLGTARVTVINRAMAERYWPGQDPVGRTVRATSMEGSLPGEAPELVVIGVVGDVRHFGYESEVREEMFTLYRQVPFWTHSMTVVARTAPEAVARLVVRSAQVAGGLDAQIPVEVSTMDERLGDLVRVRRFLMALLTGFSGLALLLAAVGVYGMLSFAVAQRTREIGVRAALGATGTDLLRFVFLRAGRVVAFGAALGLLAAWGLSRVLEASLLEDVLVDVAPTDPVAYGIAAGVLVLAAALATLTPARRASRVDPLEALRSE